jgi:hypothetical protein
VCGRFGIVCIAACQRSRFAVGPIGHTVLAEGEPVGESGQALERAFPRGMLVEIAVNNLLIFGRLVEGVGRRVRAEKTLPPRRAVGPLTHEHGIAVGASAPPRKPSAR